MMITEGRLINVLYYVFFISILEIVLYYIYYIIQYSNGAHVLVSLIKHA